MARNDCFKPNKMGDNVIGIEIIWLLISILIAIFMVENQTGFAKRMPVGEDDKRTIKQMKEVAANIIKMGSFQYEDIPVDFVVNIIVKDGAIEEVEIKSLRTIVVCDLKSSRNYIINIGGYKKIIAILLVTISVWCLQALLLPFILIVLIA